jgi:uncharacterized lipoprotein NlpE involved in copper resistance
MSRFRLILSTFVIAIFSLVGMNAQADSTTTTTVVEKHIIVTPAPKSMACTTVSAHWEGDVWVAEQSVCKYDNRAEGAAWIQDYWACSAATADGKCSAWELKPGHWVKTLP